MTEINSSSFGSITINKKRYDYDVYIFPSGKIEEREHTHIFTKKQIENLLKEDPDVIILGKGVYGVARLDKDTRDLVTEKRIELIEGDTQDIIDTFNKLSKTKKVGAIIHTTC